MTSKAQESFDEFDRLKAEADTLGLQPPGGPKLGWTLQQLRREVADAKAAQRTADEQAPAREAVERFTAESGRGTEPPVEQATRAPGEKRDVRRGG